MDVWNNLYLVLFHFVNARIKEFPVICFCNNKWSSHTRIYSDGGRRTNYSIDYRKKAFMTVHVLCSSRRHFISQEFFFPFGQNFYLNLSEARVTFSIFNGKIVTPITLSIVTKKVPNWLEFSKLLMKLFKLADFTMNWLHLNSKLKSLKLFNSFFCCRRK